MQIGLSKIVTHEGRGIITKIVTTLAAIMVGQNCGPQWGSEVASKLCHMERERLRPSAPDDDELPHARASASDEDELQLLVGHDGPETMCS